MKPEKLDLNCYKFLYNKMKTQRLMSSDEIKECLNFFAKVGEQTKLVNRKMYFEAIEIFLKQSINKSQFESFMFQIDECMFETFMEVQEEIADNLVSYYEINSKASFFSETINEIVIALKKYKRTDQLNEFLEIITKYYQNIQKELNDIP